MRPLLLIATVLMLSTAQANKRIQAPTPSALPTEIIACDDPNWPPYVFLGNEHGHPKAQGFSVDVIGTALAEHGLKLKVETMPWLRCQRELSSNGRFLLTLGAAYTPEREEHYRLSLPYHALQSTLFFIESHWPAGKTFSRKEELKTITLCAMRGFPLKNLGLEGYRVDRGHDNYQQMLDKLHYRRCDALLTPVEAIDAVLKQARLSPRHQPLSKREIPWQEATSFHALLNKHHPQGAMLQTLLNESLTTMARDGRLDALRKKWSLPALALPLSSGQQTPARQHAGE